MSKKTLAAIVLLTTIAIIVVFAGTVLKKPAPPPTRLYFGFDVRLGQGEDEKLYRPLMRYLREKTGYDFRIRFTKGYETTQENLGKGYIHFAAMGAVSYIKAKNEYGVKILVRGLNKKGQAEYQSIIFARHDSDINSIKDIKARSFAFGSQDSTQGNLIPREMLDNAGISLNDLSKYQYTGSHQNALEAVIKGDFDAGGIQDALAKKMAGQGKIKIIAESRFYPSSGIAVNKDVGQQVIETVREALIGLDPQGKHKKILPNWDTTEMPNGFTIAGDSDYSDLEEIMKKYGFINR